MSARDELRTLIGSKLTAAMTPGEAADAILSLFQEIGDDHRLADTTTLGGPMTWMDMRYITAIAYRETTHHTKSLTECDQCGHPIREDSK